jgi:hypothetical protein
MKKEYLFAIAPEKKKKKKKKRRTGKERNG